jgi:hypothetical protein
VRAVFLARFGRFATDGIWKIAAGTAASAIGIAVQRSASSSVPWLTPASFYVDTLKSI